MIDRRFSMEFGKGFVLMRIFSMDSAMVSFVKSKDQSGTVLKWSVQSSESYCCAIKTIKKEEI